MSKFSSTRIIGAGLSGLIAAHALPRVPLIERAAEPTERHKALLRFRSPEVSALVGIPFRRVTVRKGVWHEGRFVEPSIQLANQYSYKVTGSVLNDRSIWNLDPVARFIAPEDFFTQLTDHVHSRITWNTPAEYESGDITTAPLPSIIEQTLLADPQGFASFESKRIAVTRLRVHDADVFQTVYLPALNSPIYRISITGDLLICEAMIDDRFHNSAETVKCLAAAIFGIPEDNFETLETHQQKYGKIAPINNDLRRYLLYEITQTAGIYMLGRFATWRNILLDDLIHDIEVIKRLKEHDAYAHRMALA